MELDPTVVSVLSVLGALLFAGYTIFMAHRSGQPITPELLTATLQATTTNAKEIEDVVRTGVFAAEQLKKTGKLPNNNAAFDYAYRYARTQLPDLDADTLKTNIESMVLVASQISDQLAKKPKTASAPPQPQSPMLGRMGG